MGFKILSLDIKGFTDICARLQDQVETSGFEPDLVVGIPRGGIWISDNAFHSYKKSHLTLIRPERNTFKRKFKWIASRLPLWALDRLRKLEARMLVKDFNHMDDVQIILPKLDDSVGKVLVVDDALDSGATLKAVMEKFAEQYPNVDSRSAVLTITGRKTIYRPDYYLLDDSTLIRTPWSIDSKRRS